MPPGAPHDQQAEEHPFIAALPPVTDYITYMTLIEHNVTPSNLPILEGLLKDEKLTQNIGWDLVLLLLPFLPESEGCLKRIAKLGNPREVVLKVTEALRVIDFGTADDDTGSDAEQGEDEGKTGQIRGHYGSTASSSPASVDTQPTTSASLQVQQFICLLDMLSILHPRIKTKFPSRFVSTTLQAVLAAYSEVPVDINHEPLIDAMIDLERTLSGDQRPPLPPRQSTAGADHPAYRVPPEATVSGPDPEAQTGAIPDSDKLIQRRLLQSFLTHVVEQYLLTSSARTSYEDAPGWLLSGRVFEVIMKENDSLSDRHGLDKIFPQKMVLGRQSWESRWQTMPVLQERARVMKKLEALAAHRFSIPHELIAGVMETQIPAADASQLEEEPPESPSDIPLSSRGSLLLLARFNSGLYQQRLVDVPSIFPLRRPRDCSQAHMMKQFIGPEEAGGAKPAGTESEVVIDALLAIGLAALSTNTIGTPEDDEHFMQYMQSITSLSADMPSPSLRFHAHLLATSVLRSHPSDMLRLTFIRDTLENCPYENLKVSAVSWIKGETLDANPPDSALSDNKENSVFASPVALEAVGPLLFPDLTQELTLASMSEAWMKFKMRFSFYMASLNFYYLLLADNNLHQPLNVAGLHEQHDIGGSMIGPLRQASQKFQKSLEGGGELAKEEGRGGIQAALLDLAILHLTLDRVTEGVVSLNVNG